MHNLNLVLAVVFGLLAGANDGGAVLATDTRLSPTKPLYSYLTLVGLVAALPMLGFVAVGETLVDRLVAINGPASEPLVFASLVGTLLSVILLTRGGLPTSLTLAILGGLLGAGMGSQQDVAWGTLSLVLAAAAAAPLAGAMVARGLARLSPPFGHVRHPRMIHRLVFPLLAAAYALNDGQKVFVVLLLASGAHMSDMPLTIPLFAAVFFGIGVMLGWGRYVDAIATSVVALPFRPALITEGSTAIAVMVSAAAGAPVSMSQTIIGSIVGSSTVSGWGRIRWHRVSNMGLAWVFTLPLSAAVAYVTALAFHVW